MPTTASFKKNYFYIQAQTFHPHLKYFGNLNGSLYEQVFVDIMKNKRHSKQFGAILVTELYNLNWTPEINGAFFAGAIDANADYMLCSPIERFLFTHKNISNELSWVQLELYWLIQNGYTANEHEKGTLLKPPVPALAHENKEKFITLYPNPKLALKVIRNFIHDYLDTNKLERPKSVNFFQAKSLKPSLVAENRTEYKPGSVA